jgi:hypothetical protein
MFIIIMDMMRANKILLSGIEDELSGEYEIDFFPIYRLRLPFVARLAIFDKVDNLMDFR